MASQPHPEVSRILQILGKGLHRTALAQAEKLRVKDDRAGRLAMMQIFAEMNDSLGFVSCLSGLDQSEIPENLLPFAIRALTFTGQKETASHWAESLGTHSHCRPKTCGCCSVRRDGRSRAGKKDIQ